MHGAELVQHALDEIKLPVGIRHGILGHLIIKNLWPSFDSQTKEMLTTRHTKFGPDKYKPKIEDAFLKKVIKSSGIIDEVLHYAKAKQNRALVLTCALSFKVCNTCESCNCYYYRWLVGRLYVLNNEK